MDAEIFQNLRHAPRAYQIEALKNWQAKFDAGEQREFLFQMATGSGKTYVMGGVILDLFRRGYRNFVFFVNSTNILAKTRDNFLNVESPKYLFAPEIILDGRQVQIREVQNFADCEAENINIVFTTTQCLHSDLAEPHENRLSYYDFAEHDIVMLGDEAHHNNAQSMRQKNDESWEKTLQKIMLVNPRTLLLEFTATMDFEDEVIKQKYHDRMVCRYGLREFHDDCYSKEVLVYEAHDDIELRMLAAMVVSEFRRQTAKKFGLGIKPVVLFKSRTILENRANYRTLMGILVDLKPEHIESLRETATGILLKALEFFQKENIGDYELTKVLQKEFGPEQVLQVDGGRQIAARDQHAINTLENPENKIRAILAVDMLKEGWDVLNLFDIVRLYETHDGVWKNGKYFPDKTTISEAQLIGRGARYCPFVVEMSDDKFRRKFDGEPENPLRVLEQLHYHTARTVRYIKEIKATLDESGLTNFAHRKRAARKVASEIWPEQGSELPKKSNFPVRIFVEISKSSSELWVGNHTEQKLCVGWREIFTPNLIYAAMNSLAREYSFEKLSAADFKSRDEFVRQLMTMEIVVAECKEFSELTQTEKVKVAMVVLKKLANL